MKTIANAIRRLLKWLAEPELGSDPALSPREWADLPTYHPCT